MEKELTEPKLQRAVENKAIEAYIQNSCITLDAARTSPDILERLIPYGFDDAELAIGMAMQEAAHELTQKLSGSSITKEDLMEKASHAREAYNIFRGVARAAIPGLSDRINLGLVGDVPDDLQRFVSAAHRSYMAAAQDPYKDKVAKRGYPPEKLDALGRQIEELAVLGGEDGDGSDDKERAERDEMYVRLKEFMKEFKGVARTVFRKQPEMLERLHLSDTVGALGT